MQAEHINLKKIISEHCAINKARISMRMRCMCRFCPVVGGGLFM